MYKFLFMLSIIFLFISCSSKKSSLVYLDGTKKFEAISYTHSGFIMENNRLKLLATAVYLNPLYKELSNNGKENFLISTYNFDLKSYKTINNSYKFLLNNQNLLKIKKINKNNKYANSIAINNWFNYYLVSFLKTKNSAKKILLITNNREKLELFFFNK